MQILNERTWPSAVKNIRFGEDEIKRLTIRFLLNTDNVIQGFRKYIDNKMINDDLKEFDILVRTLPISTTECERGFSQMNLICSDLSRYKTKDMICTIGETGWWSKDSALTKVFGYFNNPDNCLFVELITSLEEICENTNNKPEARLNASGFMKGLCFEKHKHLYADFNCLDPNNFCVDEPLPEDSLKSINLKIVPFIPDLSLEQLCQEYNVFVSKWPKSKRNCISDKYKEDIELISDGEDGGLYA
ncbi:hypothetical protein QTP88_006266 [Uroleucon formosanum]